jgi:hypothetical protein
MSARLSIRNDHRAAIRKIAMLPYVRIIAVHIIPSVFKASNIRDRPPSTVLGWRSPQTLWGSRLENILYAGIGGPPQVAASFYRIVPAGRAPRAPMSGQTSIGTKNPLPRKRPQRDRESAGAANLEAGFLPGGANLPEAWNRRLLRRICSKKAAAVRDRPGL